MDDQADSAALFPADSGSTGNQEHAPTLVVAATPQAADEQGFYSIPRSFSNGAIQGPSTRSRSRVRAAPAVLGDFIDGIDSRDSEIRRLNNKITNLDRTQADLLVEKTALATALIEARLVLAATAPEVREELTGSIDPRDAEAQRLNDEIRALESAKSDLLVENAALASALEAAKRVVAQPPEVLDEDGFSWITQSFASPAGQDPSTQLSALEASRFFGAAPPDMLDEEGFDAITRRFANTANENASTPSRSVTEARPDVRGDFIESAASRDAETHRLNDKINALERAKSDLLAQNAALASALEASERVAAAPPNVVDDDEFSWVARPLANTVSQTESTRLRSLAPAARVARSDFTGNFDSRFSGSRRAGDKVVVFDPAERDLLMQNAMLASALKDSKRKSNLAKVLIALGGSLAGFGFHLLGSQLDDRETGIAVMAIGVGLGLMNLGWFFRPKGA